MRMESFLFTAGKDKTKASVRISKLKQLDEKLEQAYIV